MDSAENIRRIKEAALGPKKPKKYVIPKVSSKRQKKLADQKELHKKDMDFYMEVWNASPHVCVECLRKLGRTMNIIFMHHLLPKSKYPQYRHVPQNIAILCLDHHSQAEINIDKVPKVKRLTQEAEANCHKWELPNIK